MTSQSRAISLMPENEMAVAAPGYRAEIVSIKWDLVQDMYSPGKAPVGEKGKWIKIYVPSRKGLDRLMIAGGISGDIERTGTEKVEEYVWKGWYGGTYTTPAGIKIDLYDEYEFDVRPEVSARWEEKVFQEYAKQIQKKTNASYLDAGGVAYAEKNIPVETLAEFKDIAKAKATRFCHQAAQFGRQRALTGAKLRALRSYFNIGKYTAEQVQSATFVIQRTHIDPEKLEKLVGKVGAQLLLFAEKAKSMGMENQAEALSKLMLESEATQVIDGDLVEKDPFDAEATRFTIGCIKDAITAMWPEQKDLSDAKVGTALAKLLGNPKLDDVQNLSSMLSEGEALVILEYYTRLAKHKNDPEEAKKKRVEYAAIARQCIAEGILWDDETELVQGTLDKEAE